MPSMQLTLLALLGAANAANHAIVVGPSLKFHPSSVSAAEGDTVSFQIHEDHNVQQGTFSSPCQDMSGGFSSGGSFHGASVNPNLFIVTINSTDPIFGYCGEEGHCQAGMTFGINVPDSGDQTLSAYTSAAGKTSNSQVNKNVEGGIFARSVQSGSSSGPSSSSAASASTSAAASASASAAATVAASGSPSESTTMRSSSTTAAVSAGTSASSGNSSATSVSLFTGAGTQHNTDGALTSFVLAFAGALACLL